MLYAFGHPVEITKDKICQRSAEDHTLLKQAARKDRLDKGFDVTNSHVICLRCGKALSLD